MFKLIGFLGISLIASSSFASSWSAVSCLVDTGGKVKAQVKVEFQKSDMVQDYPELPIWISKEINVQDFKLQVSVYDRGGSALKLYAKFPEFSGARIEATGVSSYASLGTIQSGIFRTIICQLKN